MRRPLVVLLVLAATIAACSSDGVAAYFERVGGIIDTMRTESIAVTPRAGAITYDGVTGVLEIRRTASRALDAITAPPEVRPEHAALTAALGDLVAATDAFLVEHDGTDPAAFEAAVNSASDLGAIAQRVALACAALGDRASALGIEADIRC